MPIKQCVLYVLGFFEGKFNNHWLPIHKGIVVTISAIVALSTDLLNQNETVVVYTSNIGSDTIESCFGTLCHHAGPRASPNVIMLSMCLLMLSKINELKGFLSFIRPSNKSLEQCTPAFKAMATMQMNLFTSQYKLLTLIEKQALYYMSGFIVDA